MRSKEAAHGNWFMLKRMNLWYTVSGCGTCWMQLCWNNSVKGLAVSLGGRALASHPQGPGFESQHGGCIEKFTQWRVFCTILLKETSYTGDTGLRVWDHWRIIQITTYLCIYRSLQKSFMDGLFHLGRTKCLNHLLFTGFLLFSACLPSFYGNPNF